MENWQFLIQKQGDRTWHPLESPITEIMEGRYRVVARLNHSNVDVEVRVTYSSTLEVPPKRRIQKRSRRTNKDGLIAVIPFTDLKPGIWELKCSHGDLMSDLLGQSWQYGVHLQVLPRLSLKEVRRSSDGEAVSSLSSSVEREREKSETEATIDEPVSPVWLKAQTAEQLLKNLIELALPSSEPVLEDETIAEDSSTAIPEALLQLILNQEIYIARWGETLTIHGQVDIKQKRNQDLNQTLDIERLCAAELKIELRSPSESEILIQVRQPLGEKLVPFPIKCSIKIPNNCESKLILADVSLYGAFAAQDMTRLLAHQSFTITADVTELLAISTTVPISDSEILLDHFQEQEELKSYAQLDLKLFNLVKTGTTSESILFNPSPKKSIPPQITPRELCQTAAPELPKLPPHPPKTRSIESVTSVSTQFHHWNKHNTSTAFPYLRRIQALSEQGEQRSRGAEEQRSEGAAPRLRSAYGCGGSGDLGSAGEENTGIILHGEVSQPYISPLIRQWMHNHGYFLPEMIAGEGEEDEEVREAGEAGEAGGVGGVGGEKLILSSMSSQVPSWLAREIVVDDIYSEDSEDSEADDGLEKYPHRQQRQSLSESELPEITEPLAIPQIYLANGELIAGKSVRVIVQIPEKRPQVAIKLWVEDCQTRWLVDGPRLLTNLLPNSLGKLEVMTNIDIPFGCLEIRIEAIAVYMVTQQESHKVTIQRTVIPPDLPTFQPDELLGI